MTLREAAAQFLLVCARRNLSLSTRKAYRLDIEQFIAFAGAGVRIEACDRDLTLSYLDWLRARVGPRSVRRKGSVLSSLFAYLEDEGLIALSPVRAKDLRVKAPRRLPRGLDAQTLSDLYKLAYRDIRSTNWSLDRRRTESATKLRNVALLELLFATGARISEVLDLGVGDIDLDAGWVRFLGKGDKERTVQVTSAQTIDILRRYLKVVSGPGLFTVSYSTVRGIFSRWSRGLGRKVTPHMLRHTFATMLLDQGADLRVIQQILGHSSVSVTEIYTHVSQVRQRQVLTLMSPRQTLAMLL